MYVVLSTQNMKVNWIACVFIWHAKGWWSWSCRHLKTDNLRVKGSISRSLSLSFLAKLWAISYLYWFEIAYWYVDAAWFDLFTIMMIINYVFCHACVSIRQHIDVRHIKKGFNSLLLDLIFYYWTCQKVSVYKCFFYTVSFTQKEVIFPQNWKI